MTDEHKHEWEPTETERDGDTAVVGHGCECGLAMQTTLVFEGMSVKSVDVKFVEPEGRARDE